MAIHPAHLRKLRKFILSRSHKGFEEPVKLVHLPKAEVGQKTSDSLKLINQLLSGALPRTNPSELAPQFALPLKTTSPGAPDSLKQLIAQSPVRIQRSPSHFAVPGQV